MDIFEDYLSWKYENHELLQKLVSKRSKTISRFTPVIAVVDYLYDQRKVRRLEEDEEVFFSTGFDYIYDQFEFIKLQLENNFDNDITKLERCAKTINLAIYINDFCQEVLNYQGINKKDIDSLLTLKQTVNEYLTEGKEAPDEFFAILDDINCDIFEKNGIDVHTIDQIFYEIAIEYDIYDDNDDYDVYNNIINLAIMKDQKN